MKDDKQRLDEPLLEIASQWHSTRNSGLTPTARTLRGKQSPQSYVRIPGQRLHDGHIAVGDVQVDPVDALAARLAKVAEAAGQSPSPTLVVIATALDGPPANMSA